MLLGSQVTHDPRARASSLYLSLPPSLLNVFHATRTLV